uniref:Uncharacterized protein n=1 Tax=Anser brachyrhynchus TaxID=132585 RepID=A0A8B9B9J3_9AVES
MQHQFAFLHHQFLSLPFAADTARVGKPGKPGDQAEPLFPNTTATVRKGTALLSPVFSWTDFGEASQTNSFSASLWPQRPEGRECCWGYKGENVPEVWAEPGPHTSPCSPGCSVAEPPRVRGRDLQPEGPAQTST